LKYLVARNITSGRKTFYISNEVKQIKITSNQSTITSLPFLLKKNRTQIDTGDKDTFIHTYVHRMKG